MKRDREFTAIFYYHYLIVVFPTVGIRLPELGEPLFFHCSMTTFLQGKQKLTNQKFAHVNPRKILKRKILQCKHPYPYSNSCSTKPKLIHMPSYKISLSIQLHVQHFAEVTLSWIILVWFSTEKEASFFTPYGDKIRF